MTPLLDPPLVGILRGFSGALLPEILTAVVEGGLRRLEITMNTPGAVEQIQHAVEWAAGRLTIGAGTVTSLELLDQALGAGAEFIVTPTLDPRVVRECVFRGVPSFPGAFSPTEVRTAWELGATMVKIFPADAGGAAYIRGLRGPFPDIKLLPTGGVDLQSGREFLQAGAAGLGVGSPLFDKKRIDAGDWPWLVERTRKYIGLFAAPN